MYSIIIKYKLYVDYRSFSKYVGGHVRTDEHDKTKIQKINRSGVLGKKLILQNL